MPAEMGNFFCLEQDLSLEEVRTTGKRIAYLSAAFDYVQTIVVSVEDIGKWNERLRFKRLPPEQWKPRS